MSATNKTRIIAGSAMLAAFATLLMYFDFSVPFMPSFIKMDISDLPALIGSFAYGPIAGVAISGMKNILIIILKGTSTGCVGELSNFLLASIFTAAAGFIYKFNKTKKGAIIGVLAGACAMACGGYFTNSLLVYPVYYNFMPKEAIIAAYQAINPNVTTIGQCLLMFNVPFTFIKGMLCSAVCMVLYKPLSPILKGKK